MTSSLSLKRMSKLIKSTTKIVCKWRGNLHSFSLNSRDEHYKLTIPSVTDNADAVRKEI